MLVVWGEHTANASRPYFAVFLTRIVLQERVIGFHYLGPNAGEVTQGYAVAINMGCTKQNLDDTIGIHPTDAEVSVRHLEGANAMLPITSCISPLMHVGIITLTLYLRSFFLLVLTELFF